MKAKKCDRCGALYEDPGYVPDVYIGVYRHPYGKEYADLCDKCQESFLWWLTELGVFVPPRSNP